MSHSEGNNVRVVLAALAGNGLIAISKFVAAFLTGSLATLAEAIHSVADSVNQLLLLVGLRRAAKPPTVLHPFGHAVESYFWPFMVSILLFFGGALFALFEGTKSLIELHAGHVTAPRHGPLASYLVLGFSVVFEAFSFRVAFAEFQHLRAGRSIGETLMHAKDPTIPVVLAEDTAALVGLVIAFVSVLLSDVTGWHGFDAIGSLLIGLILASVAYFLSRRTHSLLIGEAITEQDRTRIEAIAAATPGVRSVRQLLSLHLGPQSVIVAMKVGFDASLELTSLEAVIDDLEVRIRAELPHMRYIFVEPDSDYVLDLDVGRPSALPPT